MPTRNAPRHLDHVVVACSDLSATVRRVTETTGVAPAPGGVHPRFGTRNHLVSFGEDTYLELIGIDPDNTEVTGGRPFGLDQLTGTVVSTWAVHPPGTDGAVAAARAAGCDVGELAPGSRRTADGEVLRWRLTPDHPEPSGVVPFLIDWGDTTSPARSTAARLALVALTARHPEPDRISPVLTALGTDLPVDPGSPGLSLTVEGPVGRLTL